MNSVRDEPLQILAGKWCKHDLLDGGSVLSDGSQSAGKRMRGINFVASVRANQHQMLHIGLQQQAFKQIERGRIEPLQIVKEENQGVLLACEYTYESPENELEPALRILGWKFGYWWLFSKNELQFGHNVEHEQPVWA